MLAVTCAVFAVQGCKSQKVLAVETELSAAKGRLATLEKRRQDLNAESRRLQVERKTFSHQADEAALAKERLFAAGLVLRGMPIPDGVQLDEALRAKSPKLGELAAAIVQRQLPCADPDAEPENEADGPDCSPAPVADSCEGVDARTTQSLSWKCQAIVPTHQGPAAAVCVANAELAESLYPLSAPALHVEGDVVRLAFEKNGRLVVADWPPPDLELYRPQNWAELATCEAENSHAQCVRTCDERHGRLAGGCDDWGGDGDEGGDSEEDTEPYELRAAREAAARAEAEAAQARDELAYQECLAGCETGEDAEPEAVSRVSLQYKRSPAPGLFQFDVALAEEDGGVPAHTVVISFPALHEALAGTAAPPGDDDTVRELATQLDVQRLIEGEVVEGKRIFAGLTQEGFPVGVRASVDGKTAPVDLELEDVCDFAEHRKDVVMVERCGVAKVEREKAKAAAAAKAAKAAKADAGSAVDSGVTP